MHALMAAKKLCHERALPNRGEPRLFAGERVQPVRQRGARSPLTGSRELRSGRSGSGRIVKVFMVLILPGKIAS